MIDASWSGFLAWAGGQVWGVLTWVFTGIWSAFWSAIGGLIP